MPPWLINAVILKRSSRTDPGRSSSDMGPPQRVDRRRKGEGGDPRGEPAKTSAATPSGAAPRTGPCGEVLARARSQGRGSGGHRIPRVGPPRGRPDRSRQFDDGAPAPLGATATAGDPEAVGGAAPAGASSIHTDFPLALLDLKKYRSP